MEGTLDKVPVAELLHSFCASGKSGVLHLSRGSASKRVYVKEGAIVFASSDVSEERLGERLVKAGALKRSELELACRVTESSRIRLGATLVDMGYLTRDEVEARVREQVTSILYSLFPWGSGAFRTELKDDPVEADLERRDLSTPQLLMEGVRHIDDSEAIRRGIGDLDGPLSYAVDPSKVSIDLNLTPAEGFVLSRVDGSTSPGEIAKLSPMGEEETLRCVYALVAAGLLEVRGEVAKPAPPPAPTISPETERFMKEMREKRRRAPEMTHYELLEIEPTAVPDAVKAGYLRLVKRLHPDYRASVKLDDPEGTLDDLYLRVKEAYEVLSSETERRRYDFGLSQKAERQARAQASAAANPAPRGEAQPPADPASSKTFTTDQSARIHYANGDRFFAEGRYHEAVEELRAAVRLDPSKPDYYRLLGRALAKNPKWRKQAEESFTKALDLNRFDVESYLELGELYLAGGLGTRAKKTFDEALAVDPDNARALQRLSGGRPGISTLSKLKGIIQRSRRE